MKSVKKYIRNLINRKDFPAGPWDDEPEDRVEWSIDEIECVACRSDLGAWCGYVEVKPNHPWYKSFYPLIISVHGGVTYTRYENGRLWIGFACDHYDDWIPGIPKGYKNLGRYKDFSYVEREINELANRSLEVMD